VRDALPVDRVGAADELAELDPDSDREVVAVGEVVSVFSSVVPVGEVGALSDVDVAGAVVVGVEGVDGVEGVVSRCEDALVSSPRVVVPVGEESPTSADTGFCPISSIPVTMPIATTKTATA